MLPTSPLTQTRISPEEAIAVASVRATTAVIDVLSQFVPGQKLVAHIQHQLANGAYRATIAQRDVTLSLPFSAKAGDVLDLEVVDTTGRVALAVAHSTAGGAEPHAQPAASSVLSHTGKLISMLFRGSEDPTQDRLAVLLDGGRPIAAKPPETGREMAPLLEQSLKRSGLFYESHQAKWVRSSFTASALRLEPQAQAVIAEGLRPSTLPAAPADAAGSPIVPTEEQGFSYPARRESTPPLPAGSRADRAPQPGAKGSQLIARLSESGDTPDFGREGSVVSSKMSIPDEVAPLVLRQLSSLASNVYAFHGTVWPGQGIEWEIVDEEGRYQEDPGAVPTPWTTRLRLSLPALGPVGAFLQLSGSDLAVSMTTDSEAARTAVLGSVSDLRARLVGAGINLRALSVERPSNGDIPSGIAA